MALRLRITYGRAVDFVADHQSQVARGGLLVRADVGAVDRGAPVELEVVTPAGRAAVSGRVLQVLAGAGVAIELDPAALAPLARSAEAHRDADAGPAPVHEVVPEDAEPSVDPASAHAAREPSVAHKIQQALHGDKNQRMAILREPNRMLHGYVLRNPQIQLDEIVAIARMATTSIDVLNAIAARREWAERQEVAIALVRNPRTPVPLAVRMLDHVGASELRVLAKQQSVRDAIQRAARKKLLG